MGTYILGWKWVGTHVRMLFPIQWNMIPYPNLSLYFCTYVERVRGLMKSSWHLCIYTRFQSWHFDAHMSCSSSDFFTTFVHVLNSDGSVAHQIRLWPTFNQVHMLYISAANRLHPNTKICVNTLVACVLPLSFFFLSLSRSHYIRFKPAPPSLYNKTW